MPARQLAFSHDNASKEALYSTLERGARLSNPSLFRCNTSCVRKSRPSNGLNVGVMYLTKAQLIFFAHFVNNSPKDERICITLRKVVAVRRIWNGRLLPHGMHIRCKGLPDYVFVLGSKDEQREVVARLQAAVTEAKEFASESTSDAENDMPIDLLPMNDDAHFTDYEEEASHPSEPEYERVRVRTVKKARSVKFAPTHQVVDEDDTPPQSTDEDSGDEVSPLQKMMHTAIARAQKSSLYDRQAEIIVIIISATLLIFAALGVCVSLHLLHLRISLVASQLRA